MTSAGQKYAFAESNLLQIYQKKKCGEEVGECIQLVGHVLNVNALKIKSKIKIFNES